MPFARKITKALTLLLWISLLALIYIGLQGSTLQSLAAELSTGQAAIAATAADSDLTGEVTLSATPDGVIIQATVQNAPPGEHGFHIHAGSSCADGGNAAGGHFNPDNVKHGQLVLDGFDNAHAGDLGNIIIRSNGEGTLSETIPGLNLTQGKYAIANHAIILHENMDDFGQPTGNAGGRIGCGIIQVSSNPL
ncbi:superoxide dismutase family protein [Oscillatoria sp. FACHB-1407]|uniref:superoxide dismutase family protein n=1 Tax=Oscillatoria sp. FACHB-1407 TaxID=2692847 RepID=UPI00168514C6|nr:superoxide dismutase family protein [Oscillatoria sp. FACHB-1407]MBD2465995.1 superoxide dismutase family protein [Oscillatoria sp. FACHB-1407]